MMPPGEIERMLTFMAPYRTSDTALAEPFAVVHFGLTKAMTVSAIGQ